jgi:hypothetical protein
MGDRNMKITREALEMAIAAAGESKMPLILTGHRSVITDVVIDRSYCLFDTWATRFPSELPVGIRRYGKVITKADSELGPGYNMVVDENGYRFLDQDGKEVKVEALEVSPFIDEDIRILDECELTS